MRWRVVPRVNKIGNEAAMVSTSPRPIITPALKPIAKTRTIITISTDSRRLTRKILIAESTLSGWKNIFSMLKPTGISAIIAFTFLSTILPTSGTTTLSSSATHIARAASPSTKKAPVCGSLYARRTSAISPRRTGRPEASFMSMSATSDSSVRPSLTRRLTRRPSTSIFPASATFPWFCI